MARTRVAPAARGPRRLSLVAGLLCGLAALFMIDLSWSSLLVGLHREAFVRDVLELESYSTGDGSSLLLGRVVSTGEAYSQMRGTVLPPERLQAMQEARTIAGHRVPIYYLPAERAPWWFVPDEYRVQSEEQFELASPGWALAVNGLLTVAAVAFLKRGLPARVTSTVTEGPDAGDRSRSS